MKLRLGAIVIVLALAPRVAAADQSALNLSWDDCGAAGGANMSFACDSNIGTPFTMVASFFGPDSISAFVATEMTMDLIFDPAAVPPWWQLRNQTNQLNQCRDGNISVDGDFTTYSTCHRSWGGIVPEGGLGGYVINPMLGYPNRVRLVAALAVSSADAAPVLAGEEYYAFRIVLTRAQTVGQGSCSGCDVPACIVLRVVIVDQPNGTVGGSPWIMDKPPPGGRNVITWQGGTGVDCLIVPTKNRTWGQIKTLYR